MKYIATIITEENRITEIFLQYLKQPIGWTQNVTTQTRQC